MGTSFISQQQILLCLTSLSSISTPKHVLLVSHQHLIQLYESMQPNLCRMDEKTERIKGEIIFSMAAETKVGFAVVGEPAL